MKARDWERLARKFITPHLSSFTVHGFMIFERPIGDFLRGLVWSQSLWPQTEGYVTAFVLPTYVPAKYLWGSYDRRLGGGAHTWFIDPNDPTPGMTALLKAILNEGMPFLEGMHGPAAYARFLEKHPRHSDPPLDPYVAEALAYSWIVAEDFAKASKALDNFARNANSNSSTDPEWLRKVTERCLNVRDLLAKDPQQAMAQLHEWRLFTLNNLRLGAFV